MPAAPADSRGFSLIEILMVLFVVVLMTGLVSFNIDSGASDRVLQSRVEALLAVASLALDEAQESGSDYGLLFVEDVDDRGERVVRAHWRQRLNIGWRSPDESDGVFAPIAFPAGVEVTLVLDGVAVAPAAAKAAGDESLGASPQWLFTASGETQTGELILSDRDLGDVQWRLSWDALGRFERFRGDELEPEAGFAQRP